MRRHFGNTELSFAPPARPAAGAQARSDEDQGRIASLRKRQMADLKNILAPAKLHVRFEKYDTKRAAKPKQTTSARPQLQVYFYHPDHLGTATLLTDIHGMPYQFFLNLPYGEEMATQKAPGDFSSRYKFNGKELDEETGLYYYGARYYHPAVSQWLSVDPLAEKYPGMSPYVYTADNPVVLVDPDGRDIIIKGVNNSSYTIKTHLIDKKINLSNYGIIKDFEGNHTLDLSELTPDAIGLDFNASLSFIAGATVGVNLIWHTRGEKDSEKFIPEIHIYKGVSVGTNIGGGASVGVIVAWAKNSQGNRAASSWVANGLNWTGKFDSESIALGPVTLSYFSSEAYSDGFNYWEGYQINYSPTKFQINQSNFEIFKKYFGLKDSPELFGKTLSGSGSTTTYYMLYGNGSDYLSNGTDISGWHIFNPIDPSDD